MQKQACLFLLLLAFSPAASERARVNPIGKILELLTGLRAKVIADGEAEVKAFKEYTEWCDDGAGEKQFEIKTAKSEKESLEATITKASSDIEEHSGKIEELAQKTANNEADLKAATEIRGKEHADFTKVEAELMDATDTLGRAIKVLEKHASLLQGKKIDPDAEKLAQSMGAILDAAGVNLRDRSKLKSLLQQNSGTGDFQKASAAEQEDEYAALGAPAPDAYKGHSKGIVQVLEDMLDKSEEQLSEARKEEMTAQHNFNMLKQSLEDEMKFDGEEMAETKNAKAQAEEDKATAEGDLAVTVKDLADAEKTLKNIGMDCMTAASSHEISQKSRGEEIEAISTAIKVLTEMTGAAADRSYSLLQLDSSLHTQDDLVGMEAVDVVKRLASSQKSVAMAQLASRMEAAIRVGGGSSEDPFAKVKELIKQMVERLLKEAAAEASHKAWCDEEMAESDEKQSKLTSTTEALTTKIDKATASVGTLKEEVATLQGELAKLARLQAEMDKMRAEEHDAFTVAEADLAQGVDGVRQALQVLRDYYAQKAEAASALVQEPAAPAEQPVPWFTGLVQETQPAPPTTHGKSGDAASGIIGMLEVAESDFARNLAEARQAEDTAVDEYKKTTQENKITKTTKEQDLKYKSQEMASLNKFLAETKSDLDSSQSELDAVLEYIEKLKEQCIAKPEPYEERKKRREAEIDGLKEALSILEGQSVFMQTMSRSRKFLGVKRHGA